MFHRFDVRQLLNDEAYEPPNYQTQRDDRVRSLGPATQTCANLRAYVHGLLAASMAAACGYTCRKPLARLRWPSSTLPSLLQYDRAGPERQRANGKCWDNPGMTGWRPLRPRPRHRSFAKNKVPMRSDLSGARSGQDQA